VTSVGGIFAPLNNAGQFIGPMTAWGQQTATGGASGGGVSTVTPTPPWETGTGVMPGGRNQPDASLLGDPTGGVAVVLNTPFSGFAHQAVYGGTSVAAPEMAAMWALVLSACKATPSCASHGGAYPYRLGNAAPYFWSIYNNAAQYPATFYDITFGSNALVGCELNGTCSGSPTPGPGYTAGTGYDNVTGIGVPFARHLIKAVVGV
jgi:subtilase family serine protease